MDIQSYRMIYMKLHVRVMNDVWGELYINSVLNHRMTSQASNQKDSTA